MSALLYGWTREGWTITTIWKLFIVAVCAYCFFAIGNDEDTIGLIIRITARTSLFAFILSFTARPLLQLTKASWARTLMRQRRYWGIAFFISHAAHLLFIIYQIEVHFGGAWLEATSATTLVFGGLGYVLLALMALTSTNGWIRRLGAQNWQRLHKTGAWYLWGIFTITLMLGGFATGFAPIQSLELIVLWSAFAIRVIAWRKKAQ